MIKKLLVFIFLIKIFADQSYLILYRFIFKFLWYFELAVLSHAQLNSLLATIIFLVCSKRVKCKILNFCQSVAFSPRQYSPYHGRRPYNLWKPQHSYQKCQLVVRVDICLQDFNTEITCVATIQSQSFKSPVPKRHIDVVYGKMRMTAFP